jgi:hypothetical protein
MPHYWILCLSEDNYEIARAHGLIGMSERAGKAIRGLDVGDMLTFYINRKEIDSPPTTPRRRFCNSEGLPEYSVKRSKAMTSSGTSERANSSHTGDLWNSFRT